MFIESLKIKRLFLKRVEIEEPLPYNFLINDYLALLNQYLVQGIYIFWIKCITQGVPMVCSLKTTSKMRFNKWCDISEITQLLQLEKNCIYPHSLLCIQRLKKNTFRKNND